MIEDLKVCAEIGRSTGVMMALQNHNDFLKTADQIIHVIESVDSEWLGLHLDIGSLTVHDPYEEIEKLVPFAINWQIKEEVTVQGEKVPSDLEKVFRIAKEAGYRGYLPLETLGDGASDRLPEFYARARKALQKVI
jgi:sugar phosphate isomerase/epimerase